MRRSRGGAIHTRVVFGPASRYSLAVTYNPQPPHPYNRRPGFEDAALPEQGPPGSDWWNQPSCRGRG